MREIDLPPNLVAAIFRDGVMLIDRAAIETRMLALPPDERDRVILLLTDGFWSYWGKFLTGDDLP